ncbi:uncharacterized protein LOC105380516 [Plutella xylostella]|uniref:uncharacterized protein LOC105380516 n=1 Tax=Plutella xylostella TaxID=51655 RepID=UPI002032F384|nr:uncharacterized protein LOC105380516 [Plutella xylostella]
MHVNLFREVYIVRFLLLLWFCTGSLGVRYPEYSGVEMPHYDYDANSQPVSGAPAGPAPGDEDYHEPDEPQEDYNEDSPPDKNEKSFLRKESWSPYSRKIVSSRGHDDDTENMKNYKIERPVRHKSEFSPTKRNWFNRQKDLRDEIVMKGVTVPRYMNQDFRQVIGKNKEVFSKNKDAELEEPVSVISDALIRRKPRDRSLIEPSIEYDGEESFGLHRQPGLRAEGGRMTRGEREEALRQRQRDKEKVMKAPPRPKRPLPEEDDYDYDDMKRIQKVKSKVTTPPPMSLLGQRRLKMQKRGRQRERFRKMRRSTLNIFQDTTNSQDEDMNDPAFYTGIHVNILNEVLPAIDDRRKHLIAPSTAQTLPSVVNYDDESLAPEDDVRKIKLHRKHPTNKIAKNKSVKRKNKQRYKAKKVNNDADEKENSSVIQGQEQRLTSPTILNELKKNELKVITNIKSYTVGGSKKDSSNLFTESEKFQKYNTIEKEFKRDLENQLNIQMIQKLVTDADKLDTVKETNFNGNKCIKENENDIECKNPTNSAISKIFEITTTVNSSDITLHRTTSDTAISKSPLTTQQRFTNASLDDKSTINGCTTISENSYTYNASMMEERLEIIKKVLMKENLVIGVYEDGDVEELKESEKKKSKGRMNRQANFWAPEYLDKVKEVMRRRLVARAETPEQLAEDWNDLVCEDIDVETLQKKISNLAPHRFSTADVLLFVPFLFWTFIY